MDLENLQAIICISHNYTVSKASLRQECFKLIVIVLLPSLGFVSSASCIKCFLGAMNLE